MSAESVQPQIYEVSHGRHTVQWGWLDYYGGYMRIEPPIVIPDHDNFRDALYNGAAAWASEEGLLATVDPIVGSPAGSELDGGTLFWIDIGEGNEEPPKLTPEERNERATNVAKVLMVYAAAAASSEGFKKLFNT